MQAEGRIQHSKHQPTDQTFDHALCVHVLKYQLSHTVRPFAARHMLSIILGRGEGPAKGSEQWE